jgi:hypothetical protein
MPDYPASAVSAGRRELMYCALKAIECMPAARHYDFEGFVVVVSTHFALCHLSLLPLQEIAPQANQTPD